MEKRKAKHEIISRYLSGGTSTRKLAKEYGYGHVTISRWIMAHKKYGKEQPLIVFNDALKEGLMPTDIGELQEALRQALLKVELLEAMIDITDEQLGTDIRKKAGTSQS